VLGMNRNRWLSIDVTTKPSNKGIKMEALNILKAIDEP